MGASNDLLQVRNIARRMVAQWGFSKDSLSPTAWEPAESPGMFAGSTAASEETESTIDALLEKETIDGFELDALIEKYTGAPAPNPRPSRSRRFTSERGCSPPPLIRSLVVWEP